MLNRLRCLPGRRWKSNSTIKRFIDENRAIANTTVFQGTLYEHTVMRELQGKLAMTSLQKTGGANDRGVDIRGSWDVAKVFHTMNPILKLDQTEVPARCKLNGVTFKPFRHKLPRETQLKVLVQCKAFTSSKVAPKEFRELLGTFASLVSGPQRNKTAIMMCSPNMLTKDGLSLINSVPMPLIYLRIEMLRLKGADYDIADSGRLLNYYENEYAAQFLQGMGIKEWLKLSMFK
ncbi:hypothetical protein HG536_0H01180 [Torulaspora globosa]|uniref:Required for respiratory growth protein 7, mitochondrial n=1 Tax=Torulaspora globosa TaxID=48254 RepID=A0A7G3ZMK7_9SACH|nr:uncharacterized protein HG536_0H01180 [Torulaspora globosa]QLL34743.1 hypothetical protein HG536_0H01180 [Torulaspora globosa]